MWRRHRSDWLLACMALLVTAPGGGAQTSSRFPAASEFQLGEAVVFFDELEGPVDCAALYLRGALVAAVAEFFHVGSQAIVQRCLGWQWADQDAPTAVDITGTPDLDGMVAGYVRLDYDTLVVAAGVRVAFAPIAFPKTWGNIAVYGDQVAYIGGEEPRETPDGERMRQAVAVIYDYGTRAAVVEQPLGSCFFTQAASDFFYFPEAPAWAGDGSSVRFRGNPELCDFGERLLRR